MEFSRTFSEDNVAKMLAGDTCHVLTDADFSHGVGKYEKLNPNYNAALFSLLKNEVPKGIIFPAVRGNELHFYYKGGCLYKFVNGVFLRDTNYRLYGAGTGKDAYANAKMQNENKYTNKKGEITERQLLDKLYCHTFGANMSSKVVVLDIEVNLKGNVGNGKKCDLVLLNTQTDAIMFVEGKVFADKRVRCAVGYLPEVIQQVNVYTAAMTEQRQNILLQYCEHVRIINELFDVSYNAPQTLVEPAKLLVYKTCGGKQQNVSYTMDIINQKLGVDNVMWTQGEPTLEEIWNALDGEVCK